MPVTETTIRLAENLYRARRTMRTLLGAGYDEKIAFMKPGLQRFAEHIGTDDILVAATQLALRVDPLDGMERLLIMATAVEILEPTSPTVTGDLPECQAKT